MLEVNIEKIIPVTEARDSLNSIVDVVEGSDELYVITKNGKPAAIIVGVHHLEKLTGIDHKEIMPDEDSVKETTEDNPTDQTESAADDNFTIDQSDDIFAETPAPAPSTNTMPAVEPESLAEDSKAFTNLSADPIDDILATPPVSPATAPQPNFSDTPATAPQSAPAMGQFSVPASTNNIADDSADDIFASDDNTTLPNQGQSSTTQLPVNTGNNTQSQF